MNKIFITRPLPPEVLKKAQTLGEVTARNLTSPLTTKEMTEALQNFDIILPTLGDLFSESILQKVTKIRCKLLANFGAGYNHIAVEAAYDDKDRTGLEDEWYAKILFVHPPREGVTAQDGMSSDIWKNEKDMSGEMLAKVKRNNKIMVEFKGSATISRLD